MSHIRFHSFKDVALRGRVPFVTVLLVVMVFMLVYYRLPGLAAALALIVFALVLLLFIAVFRLSDIAMGVMANPKSGWVLQILVARLCRSIRGGARRGSAPPPCERRPGILERGRKPLHLFSNTHKRGCRRQAQSIVCAARRAMWQGWTLSRP